MFEVDGKFLVAKKKRRTETDVEHEAFLTFGFK
jgi:hypothetical protein